MIAQEIETKCTASNFSFAVSFAFCIPHASKYLIVQKRKECGIYDGYWACDGTGCLRQFIPIRYEVSLQYFMSQSLGFYKFVQAELDTTAHHGENRMIFYGDACELDENAKHLRCSANKNEGQNEFDQMIIAITPNSANNFIPYPVIEPEEHCLIN